MNIIITIIIIIVIAIGVFLIGVRVGAGVMNKMTLKVIFNALDESSLTNEQKMEIANKIGEIVDRGL